MPFVQRLFPRGIASKDVAIFEIYLVVPSCKLNYSAQFHHTHVTVYASLVELVLI